MFAVIYALIVREYGGRKTAEEFLESWANEVEMREAQLDPRRPVPVKAAQDMLDVMAMGGPAPRRTK